MIEFWIRLDNSSQKFDNNYQVHNRSIARKKLKVNGLFKKSQNKFRIVIEKRENKAIFGRLACDGRIAPKEKR